MNTVYIFGKINIYNGDISHTSNIVHIQYMNKPTIYSLLFDFNKNIIYISDLHHKYRFWTKVGSIDKIQETIDYYYKYYTKLNKLKTFT